jgi:hypothetical protein
MGTMRSNPRLKRSMRVATLFTGAAAATVGMTQVANAQDVAHPAHKPTPKHIAGQVRPAITKLGNIKSSWACAEYSTPRNPTWLHAVYDSVQNHASYSYCYGGKGSIVSPHGTGITYECGGNNHGLLVGYSDGGTKSWSFRFRPGTTYAHLNRGSLYLVAIWSWSGTDKCRVL